MLFANYKTSIKSHYLKPETFFMHLLIRECKPWLMLNGSTKNKPAQMQDRLNTIDILYTLDSTSLLVKLKPRIFQRLPPFE